ncbi:hypothetical protein HJC23_003699 [Cyclotella cryptica]|uniref:Uncharacterized protein n=1 Tax=Cyclotella cryptica TaxID=29204 RepID=A0ABD3QTQ6_9STRA
MKYEPPLTNVAPRLLGGSKPRSLLLQLGLELIKLCIRKTRYLASLRLRLTTGDPFHERSSFRRSNSASLRSCLPLKYQANELARLLVNDAILIVGNAVLRIVVRLEEPPRRSVVAQLLARAGDGGPVFGAVCGPKKGRRSGELGAVAGGVACVEGGCECDGCGGEACHGQCEAGCVGRRHGAGLGRSLENDGTLRRG